MSLKEFTAELVNDAKLSSEAEETIFKLEQIKEVILHREKGLAVGVFAEVVDLMTKPSPKVKKYLCRFASEILYKHPAIVFHLLNLFLYLKEDGNDSVRQSVVYQLAKIYDRVAIAIVNSSNKSETFRSAWMQLSSIIAFAEDLIGSEEISDSFKLDCARLLESSLQFGFPSLERGDSSTTAGDNVKNVTKFTSADIPIHHAHCNREDIENASDTLFSKLVLWITRGGTSGAQFNLMLSYTILTVVAKVVVERSSAARLSSASKAFINFLTSKKTLQQQLDIPSREIIAKYSHRMLSLLSAIEVGSGDSGELESLRERLKAAVDGFDAETSGKRVGANVADPRKRQKLALDKGTAVASTGNTNTIAMPSVASFEDTEGSEVTQQVHDSAVAAVNAAELKFKALLAHESPAAKPSDSGSDKLSGSGISYGADVLCHAFCSSASTSMDMQSLFTLQDLSNTKILSIQTQPSGGITFKASSIMVNVIESQYQNVAYYSLERMLNCLSEFKLSSSLLVELLGLNGEENIEIANKSAREAFVKVAVKAVLSMGQISSGVSGQSLAECVPSKGNCSVTLYRSASLLSDLQNSLYNPFKHTNCYSNQISLWQSVPCNISLPKVLWAFVSVLLANLELQMSNASDKARDALYASVNPTVISKKRKTDSDIGDLNLDTLDFLLGLLEEIGDKEDLWRKSIIDTGADTDDELLFDQLSVVVLSRLLARKLLKPLSWYFIKHISKIPLICVKFLSLVMYTGGVMIDMVATKEHRAVRMEAGSLLGFIVERYNTSSEVVSARAALYSLLWSSVSAAEMDARTNAISVITSTILTRCKSLWVVKAVYVFALQSACHIMHRSFIQTRLQLSEDSFISDSASASSVAMDVEEASPATSSAGVLLLNKEQMEVEEDEKDEEMPGKELDEEQAGVPQFELDYSQVFAEAVVRYDAGASFELGGGPFLFTPSGNLEPALMEDYLRTYMQLLSQLCLVDCCLLEPMLRIYGLLAYWTQLLKLNDKLQGKAAVYSSMTVAFGSIITAVAPAIVQKRGLISSGSLPLDEFLISVVGKADDFSFPALFSVLESASNLDVVIKTKNVNLLKGVISNLEVYLGRLGDLLVSEEENNRLIKLILKNVLKEFVGVDDESVFDFASTKLMLPLLSGCEKQSLESKWIPQLIRFFPPTLGSAPTVGKAAAPDILKRVFGRIIQYRYTGVPAISKVDLLVFLHKFDFERFNIKQKAVLDSVSVCLEQMKDEFTSDVVTRALDKLMVFEEGIAPPQALMRTAILASSKYEDCKRHVLVSVIPSLIKGNVWKSSSALWDGVVFFIKKFHTSKDAEHSLRAALKIPGAQLKALVDSCSATQTDASKRSEPDFKKLLLRIFSVLPATEKSSVLGEDTADEAASQNRIKEVLKILGGSA